MWFFVFPGSEFFSAVSKERQKWCFRKALSSPPPASNPGQQRAREEGQESLERWGDCRATETVLPQALYCQTQVPCRRRGKVSQQIAWRQIFVFLSVWWFLLQNPTVMVCYKAILKISGLFYVVMLISTSAVKSVLLDSDHKINLCTLLFWGGGGGGEFFIFIFYF